MYPTFFGLRTLFDDVVTFATGGRPPPRERSRLFFWGFRVVGFGWWVKDTFDDVVTFAMGGRPPPRGSARGFFF